jgi:hypothetical protein
MWVVLTVSSSVDPSKAMTMEKGRNIGIQGNEFNGNSGLTE